MVANYRCNELKDEAIKRVKDTLNDFKNRCAADIVQTFAEESK